MFHRRGVGIIGLCLLGVVTPAASVVATHAAPIPAWQGNVRAANGMVTGRSKPVRIVSLSPTLTEDLYAIGAGKQVVAVDKDSDYPARAPRTKLDGIAPNAEAIAKFHPDLVLISNDMAHIVSELRKLRIPVLVEPPATKLNQVYSEINRIGTVTGHAKKARALSASMKSRIARLVRSVPAQARTLSVYNELSPDLYSATSKTFIGQVYKLFGLKNIADAADRTGSGYPQLSNEYVIAANPDLIVLADDICCGQSPQTVAARPGWSTISAVEHRRVVPVNDDIASRWGPRLVTLVRIIARALKTP